MRPCTCGGPRRRSAPAPPEPGPPPQPPPPPRTSRSPGRPGRTPGAARGALARTGCQQARCHHVRTPRPPPPPRPRPSSGGPHRAGGPPARTPATACPGAAGAELAAHRTAGPGRAPPRSAAGAGRTRRLLHSHPPPAGARRGHGRAADPARDRLLRVVRPLTDAYRGARAGCSGGAGWRRDASADASPAAAPGGGLTPARPSSGPVHPRSEHMIRRRPPRPAVNARANDPYPARSATGT